MQVATGSPPWRGGCVLARQLRLWHQTILAHQVSPVSVAARCKGAGGEARADPALPPPPAGARRRPNFEVQHGHSSWHGSQCRPRVSCLRCRCRRGGCSHTSGRGPLPAAQRLVPRAKWCTCSTGRLAATGTVRAGGGRRCSRAGRLPAGRLRAAAAAGAGRRCFLGGSLTTAAADAGSVWQPGRCAGSRAGPAANQHAGAIPQRLVSG